MTQQIPTTMLFRTCSIVRCSVFALIAAALPVLGCHHKSSAVSQPRQNASKTASIEPVGRSVEKPPVPPLGTPTFVSIGSESGITFHRFDDIRGLHRILEANGGGVSLFDFDGDGRLDVFLTNGCELPLRTKTSRHSNQLFHNRGAGKFERVTLNAGVFGSGYFQGCTTGDFDGDGFDDLYVTAFGANMFWQNQGDGTFRDVTTETGARDESWGSSVAMADFNRDGHLDLYIVNYLKADDDPPKLCPQRESPDGYVQCPPHAFPAADDVLLLSDGAGKFRNINRVAGIVAPDGKGLGVVVFDMNRDGWPDICVANDGVPNFLYLNRSAIESSRTLTKFREQGAEFGIALNYQGDPEASMGIACGDSDGDGWLDLFMTHFYSETNTLYRNHQGRTFLDETVRTGLGPPSRNMLGFGTEFLDFDNDGWLDLFVANGHVDDIRWISKGQDYGMKPQLFRNLGQGVYREISRWSGGYFGTKWIARGAATGDLDNDGDLDLVISHQVDSSAVLRNDTKHIGASVLLKLVGKGKSNRSAVGSRIIADGLANRVVREVIGGGGFQSSSDRRVHIGLGNAKSIARLRIQWPSGQSTVLKDVGSGQYVIVEGQELFRLPTAQQDDAALRRVMEKATQHPSVSR